MHDHSATPARVVSQLEQLVDDLNEFLLAYVATRQSRDQIPVRRWARDLLANGITRVPRNALLVSTWREVQIVNRLAEMIADGAVANTKRQLAEVTRDESAPESLRKAAGTSVAVYTERAHRLHDHRALTDPQARRPWKGTKP